MENTDTTQEDNETYLVNTYTFDRVTPVRFARQRGREEVAATQQFPPLAEANFPPTRPAIEGIDANAVRAYHEEAQMADINITQALFGDVEMGEQFIPGPDYDTKDYIEFRKEYDFVGKLFIEDNKLKFIGDLDDAAILLFDKVRELHSRYVNRIYNVLGSYMGTPNRDGLYLADEVITTIDRPFPFTQTKKILL